MQKDQTIIAITGTPGTGKSALSEALSTLLSCSIITLSDLKNRGLDCTDYDEKRDCAIVSETEFVKYALAEIKQKNCCIIDSHLSHFLPKKHVSLCIVLHCNLSDLKQRLEQRNYSSEKVQENLQAEIFDTILCEAKQIGHTLIELDSSLFSPQDLAVKAKSALNHSL